MFSILDRYIGKSIFNAVMMALFILVSLSGIIKFAEQLRKVGQGSYSALDAGLFTCLTIPKDIQIFFPMATLLGALIGLGSLASHSEIVVIQACGFSRLNIARSMVKSTIPLVILTMAIGEWLAPISENIAYNYRIRAIYGGSMLSTPIGLWAKDGDDFIFIERVVSSDKLFGINIYHFDTEKRLQWLRHAATAFFSNNSWTLVHVDYANLTNGRRILGRQMQNSEWKTDLTPEKLRIAALEPNALSVLALYNYINYLKRSGQDSNRYQLNIWSRVFSPLSVAVMMLMALSFIFGPLCRVSMGAQIVTGISFGFLFYILNQLFGPLSLAYNMPPLLGALLPSSMFLIISIVILLRHL